MAVNINILNTGNMTLGSSGNSKTRFTLQGGTVEEYDIAGTLSFEWMCQNRFYEDVSPEENWSAFSVAKEITNVDIGSHVTEIGDQAFTM